MIDKKAIKWINMNFSMYQILTEDLDVDIPPNGMLFCPFHNNKDTKAAKYFEKSNSMFCWSEYKVYTPYKALKFLGYSDEDLLDKVPDDYKDMNYEDDSLEIPILLEEVKKFSNLKSCLNMLDYYWNNKNKSNFSNKYKK
mgnify:CR=1 FL=1